MEYVHIAKTDEPPLITSPRPFKAVVVIEVHVAPERRKLLSRWLVKSGCMFMMAWGDECSAWDDAVDEANLELFDYGEIPDDRFVMTTWHEDESLSDVFWFSKNAAKHLSVNLESEVIVHIADADRRCELTSVYMNA